MFLLSLYFFTGPESFFICWRVRISGCSFSPRFMAYVLGQNVGYSCVV
jgi:hypothetical protein